MRIKTPNRRNLNRNRFIEVVKKVKSTPSNQHIGNIYTLLRYRLPIMCIEGRINNIDTPDMYSLRCQMKLKFSSNLELFDERQ